MTRLFCNLRLINMSLHKHKTTHPLLGPFGGALKGLPDSGHRKAFFPEVGLPRSSLEVDLKAVIRVEEGCLEDRVSHHQEGRENRMGREFRRSRMIISLYIN